MIKAIGVGRMFDNDRALLVIFDKKSTDDQLRAVHERIGTMWEHGDPCPSCGRHFKDGETCSYGGCPMGGDV